MLVNIFKISILNVTLYVTVSETVTSGRVVAVPHLSVACNQNNNIDEVQHRSEVAVWVHRNTLRYRHQTMATTIFYYPYPPWVGTNTSSGACWSKASARVRPTTGFCERKPVPRFPRWKMVQKRIKRWRIGKNHPLTPSSSQLSPEGRARTCTWRTLYCDHRRRSRDSIDNLHFEHVFLGDWNFGLQKRQIRFFCFSREFWLLSIFSGTLDTCNLVACVDWWIEPIEFIIIILSYFYDEFIIWFILIVNVIVFRVLLFGSIKKSNIAYLHDKLLW